MILQENKFIDDKFEEAMNLTATILRTDFPVVLGLLRVGEVCILAPRNKRIWIQVIVNPWAWPEVSPTIHIIGSQIQGRLPKNVKCINPDIPRYELNLKKSWTETSTIEGFLNEIVAPWIEGHSNRIMPTTEQGVNPTFNLRYFIGLQDYTEKLKRFASANNIKLVTKEEEGQIRIEEELVVKRLFEETRLKIMNAAEPADGKDCIKELNDINFDGFTPEQVVELEEFRAEKIAEISKEKPDPPSPFPPDVVLDDDIHNKRSIGPKIRRRKKNRTRKIEEEE